MTHVHEMQGRYDEGAAWLASRSDDWAPDNGFAYHNWWHLALFHLERCDTAAALALLDERVMPGAEFALQRIDISALLWRLRLMGVDVGERFAASAAGWPAGARGRALRVQRPPRRARAGRRRPARRRRRAWSRRRARSGRERSTLGAMAADVGVPLMLGVLAHGRGRHADAVEALWAARDGCHRFGGSHAQRDLVDQTLIDAAIRAGQPRLARHLLNERALIEAGDAVRRALASPRRLTREAQQATGKIILVP